MEVKGKTKKKKVVKFGFAVGDAFFDANDETAQKIFAALGIKKAYDTSLRMECSAYHLAVSDRGIAAEAVQTLDYGTEKFLQCKVGENIVYVKSDETVSGGIYLMPDFGHVGIVEIEREIKII